MKEPKVDSLHKGQSPRARRVCAEGERPIVSMHGQSWEETVCVRNTHGQHVGIDEGNMCC